MVDTDLGPPMWQTHRWSGVEVAVDWNLFWGCCHFLLEDVCEVVFAVQDATRTAAAEEARGCEPGMLALEEGEVDEQGAGDGDDDERHHVPEQDLGMPDQSKTRPITKGKALSVPILLFGCGRGLLVGCGASRL